jgi:23S rRNA (guanosine2251-2'-O)-methyltransferase
MKHPHPPAGPRGKQSEGAPGTCVLYGLHAALAALENPRRAIRRVLVTENVLPRIQPMLARRSIEPEVLRPRDLDLWLGAGAVHQGIALDAEPLAQPDLTSLLAAIEGKPRAAIAMLDQVTDPHNAGAVLRSAAAFALDGFVVQARHSPPLSGALAKAASGGLEAVPVAEAVNLARALEEIKAAGFFCLGFDSEAKPLGAAMNGIARIALVFGAENKGLRRLVREGCDALVSLRAPGRIKSLNVSNAAAIAFYEAARRFGA